MKFEELAYGLPVGAFLKNGKYRIDGVIGSGGFGITYLGTRFEDDVFLQDKKVVIKELFINPASEKYHCMRDPKTKTYVLKTSRLKGDYEHFINRFKNEANILHNYRHETNMVNVLDYFEENGTAYFTMAFIDSIDLDKFIKQNGILSIYDTHKLLKPIGELLIRLHHDKVLHRDIKPPNVLIDNNKTLYLIDFGISKNYTSLGKVSGISVTGTDGYAPPELALQNATIAPSIDVYSFAATYFFCLTGRHPQTSIQIRIDGKKTIKELNPSISENVSTVIDKAMQDQVTSRTKTIGEFMSQIEMCLANTYPKTDPEKELNTTPRTKPTLHVEQHNKPKKITTPVLEKEVKKKNKIPLYITLVMVLGVAGFFGTKELLNITQQPQENTINSPKPVKIDSVAYTKLDKTNATALTNFISQYKNGEYVALAQHTLDSINKVKKQNDRAQYLARKKQEEAKKKRAEQNAWNTAISKNTITAYTSFINQYQNSNYTSEAHNRIDNLKREEKQRLANEKIIKRNNLIKTIFNEGNKKLKSSSFNEALSKYNEVINIDSNYRYKIYNYVVSEGDRWFKKNSKVLALEYYTLAKKIMNTNSINNKINNCKN